MRAEKTDRETNHPKGGLEKWFFLSPNANRLSLLGYCSPYRTVFKAPIVSRTGRNNHCIFYVRVFCCCLDGVEVVESIDAIRSNDVMTMTDSFLAGKRFFVITFVGSILWIAAYSYLMVWWANLTGETVNIPPEVSRLKGFFIRAISCIISEHDESHTTVRNIVAVLCYVGQSAIGYDEGVATLLRLYEILVILESIYMEPHG